MAIPQEALDLIKGFEGYLRRLNDGTDRVKPYLCPANVPTIGYGSTRYFPGGAKVKMSDPPIYEARAAECLAGELIENERDFDKMTTRKVHALMRGAIISFIYNCGSGAYRASTLRKVINDGAFSDVPSQLNKWVNGGGRRLPGLVRRRKDEGTMFMLGVRRMNSDGVYNGDAPVTAPAPEPQTIPTVPSQPETVTKPKGIWRTIFDWILS
jgi:lysozyme